MVKMLGRLRWRGQCACCAGPKGQKAIRAEEKQQVRREIADAVTERDYVRRANEAGITVQVHELFGRPM